ncbi:MAG: ATP-binding protein [Clostridiales bacterium]|nr:ATP-binding protein [Clostridiales bacterium]
MESQIIEWNESWSDEYLKWICAFANTQGCIMVIGKDHEGNISGLDSTEKLSEDLPNKIRNALVQASMDNQQKKEHLMNSGITHCCKR